MCVRHPATLALFAALLLFAALAGPATAERERLGYGRLVVNDQFGDLRDRDRSGAYASSRVWGPTWRGRLPAEPGTLLELRIHGEIMTPRNLERPSADDRPYAGALSLGLHTHFRRGAAEMAAGLDLVVTGPQTGLGTFQSRLHEALAAPVPSDRVLDDQIRDGLHPTIVTEAARTWPMDAGRLRPFVEARLGAETLLRAGADLTIGPVGADELLVREASTGHRYRVVTSAARGMSLVLGADVAAVRSSVFLPADRGYDLRTRRRARIGVHWQGERRAIFYGLAWLDREFARQDTGQLLGALRLDIRF